MWKNFTDSEKTKEYCQVKINDRKKYEHLEITAFGGFVVQRNTWKFISV